MSGELILIVDDEPNIVQLARMYLKRVGFRVEAVGDGWAALAALDEMRPARWINHKLERKTVGPAWDWRLPAKLYKLIKERYSPIATGEMVAFLW